VFALYAATLSTDVIRKLADFPNSISAIVYVLTGLIYFFLLPKALSRGRVPPRPLPVWLVLLSLWCATEAIVHRIPVGIALLGWVSYVFFVPLFYIGAELMADDRHAATALRVAALAGGIVGLGAITSAVLGQAAPASLQPIVPSVGIHSFSAGNVYLAPSIFATAEEASEQLLIALFAWAALTQLPSGRLGRMSSVLLGVLIAVGLFATARRADIFVAVSGIVALVCFGFVRHSSSTGQPDPWAVRARRRLGTALILAAIGSVALLSFLGASKLVPFLTSGSAGSGTLSLMFSPSHPGSLTGQGTGTSTQGAGLVGATSFTGFDIQGKYTGNVIDGRAFTTAEGGLTKTWLELGFVGVVIYGGVFASALGPAIRSLVRLDGAGRALIILTIALGVVFLKGHQSLDNPLVQPLFWLGAGGAWGRLRIAARARHRNTVASSPPVTASNGIQRPVSLSGNG